MPGGNPVRSKADTLTSTASFRPGARPGDRAPGRSAGGWPVPAAPSPRRGSSGRVRARAIVRPEVRRAVGPYRPLPPPRRGPSGRVRARAIVRPEVRRAVGAVPAASPAAPRGAGSPTCRTRAARNSRCLERTSEISRASWRRGRGSGGAGLPDDGAELVRRGAPVRPGGTSPCAAARGRPRLRAVHKPSQALGAVRR